MKKRLKVLCLLLIALFMIGASKEKVLAYDDEVLAYNITANSATLDWTKWQDVMIKEYGVLKIYGYRIVVSGNQFKTTGTTYQLTGLNAGSTYNVEIYADVKKADGEDGDMLNYVIFDTGGYTAVVNDPVTDPNTNPGQDPQPGTQQPTQPSTPQIPVNVSLSTPTIVDAYYDNGSVYASTTDYGAAQGMEFCLFTKDNVLVGTDDSLYSSGSFYGLSANTVYYVQARGYVYDSNYNRVYSQWSGKKYIMPQPQANSKRKWIKRNSVKINWKKVSGANKYIVYARKHNAKKWNKVGTTSKTSFTVKKVKGKKIVIGSNGYDIMVVSQGTFEGTTIKSIKSLYVNVWRS